MRRIAVFCVSGMGSGPVYADAARQLAAYLAGQGIGLVYGGANVGLMGAVADAALAAGAEVIGVIPRALMDKEIAHRGLTALHVVASMHERKAMMADLADAFIALPGGFGTFDEFCEILTWAQLGLHARPCGLLNTAGYYDGLLAMFDHAVSQGFLKPAHRALVLADPDPASLLQAMRSYQPVVTGKWVGR
jgi:uncharacterized protein (TIGR00730 family)